jgi:hypothetical protein
MRVHLPFNIPNIAAITIWPFIFISNSLCKDTYNNKQELIITLKHEDVHYKQQQRWAIYGLGIGLLVWFLLYELCLPFYWNPWRRRWETEAYSKGNGFDQDTIDIILCGPPYWLHSNKK